jgi:tight adherence protein B
VSPLWSVLLGGGLAALILALTPDSSTRLRALTSAAAGADPFGRARVPAAPWRGRRRTVRIAALIDAAVTVPYSLSLELRSGRDLSSALQAVSAEMFLLPDLARYLSGASDVARAGGDVGPVLRDAAHHGPGSLGPVLVPTAACCSAAAGSGLPLADLLAATAATARAGLSVRGLAKAELAGARATTAVLAGLPMVGIAMAQLLGASPFTVLTQTPWGLGCLAIASVLTGVGLLWSRAISAGLLRTMP